MLIAYRRCHALPCSVRYFGSVCANSGHVYVCGIGRSDVANVSPVFNQSSRVNMLTWIEKFLFASSRVLTVLCWQVFAVNPTSGTVQRTQVLLDTSPYKQYSTYFGSSVAMDGTILVVGSRNDRSATYTYSAGSAYIYTRTSTSATTYTKRTRMLHPSPVGYDYCGTAVAGTCRDT